MPTTTDKQQKLEHFCNTQKFTLSSSPRKDSEETGKNDCLGKENEGQAGGAERMFSVRSQLPVDLSGAGVNVFK